MSFSAYLSLCVILGGKKNLTDTEGGTKCGIVSAGYKRQNWWSAAMAQCLSVDL